MALEAQHYFLILVALFVMKDLFNMTDDNETSTSNNNKRPQQSSPSEPSITGEGGGGAGSKLSMLNQRSNFAPSVTFLYW